MELRDLIVTPLLLVFIYWVAYVIRPLVTDHVTRTYFLPALTVRVVGALALGIIYQFYYGGGDTFNYHTHGSRHLWEAFMDSPDNGLKFLFNDGTDVKGIYKYASKVLFFRDPSSYAIVKVAFLCDLFTFSSYSATAVLFALFSFAGMWMFFLTFYEQYPHLHRQLAFASFFIPSVFFWGSGLMKDTLTLGCLGLAVYQTYRIGIAYRFSLRHVVLLMVALYGLYSIKVYILLTFLPAAIVWIFLFNFSRVRSAALRMLLFPFIMAAAGGLAYFSILKAGQDNAKYSIDTIAKTAQVTAYDIRYWSGRNAGSGYSLGELDGSIGSMVKLAPKAINASLFRPYLWEVNNPLMLLSAFESVALLLLVMYFIVRVKSSFFKALSTPNMVFLLVFALSFSFAVGVSTFNFGTLVRYKIPMLPFFGVALILGLDYAKRLVKVEVLETIE